MLIDFKIVARANVFTSVRETGMQDSGGAHPIPIDAAFVYDTRAQMMIALDDLFIEPAVARRRLADFARDALMKKLMAQAPKPGEGSPEAIREWKDNTLKMINDGTKPTTDNFSYFIVRAGVRPNAPSPGITLIFPPYQFAAYVFGTQTVDVPAEYFAATLKSQYWSAFAR